MIGPAPWPMSGAGRGIAGGHSGFVPGVTTFGIIGAGNIGSAVARAVIAHGHTVVIANSRGPESLAALVEELGPSARAAGATEAGQAGEVVVVTVPFGRFRHLPVGPLAGKIVIDTNNYYWERDGRFPELDKGEATTSGLVQAHLRGARVVKAFNHIGASEINADGLPTGTPGRRALAVSSDHPEAVAFVVDLYDQLGFDAVDVSPLSESWRVERDRPAYVVRQTREELVANLAKATRTI